MVGLLLIQPATTMYMHSTSWHRILVYITRVRVVISCNHHIRQTNAEPGEGETKYGGRQTRTQNSKMNGLPEDRVTVTSGIWIFGFSCCSHRTNKYSVCEVSYYCCTLMYPHTIGSVPPG